MVVPRYSFWVVFLLSACVHSSDAKDIVVNNRVEGCFTVTNTDVDGSVEPVILTASINTKNTAMDCVCKSALMAYEASQSVDKDVSKLMAGNFSILNRKKIVLPVAAQNQLIYPNTPIQIRFSCANF